MLEYKKVSVVTILEDQADFLETLIKSFAYQNYANMEWFIVDNSTKEDLLEPFKAYAQKDLRVHLLKNSTPLKKLEIYKKLLVFLQGDYVAFLEPPCLWVKDKISRQVGFSLRYNTDLSHTSYAFADRQDNLLALGCYHTQKETNYLSYQPKNPVNLSTVMAQKDKLRVSFEKTPFDAEDNIFIHLLRSGFTSSGITEVMTLTRPVFSAPVQKKLDSMIATVLAQNPEDTATVSKLMEHFTYHFSDAAKLKLDPSICIGHDVVDSLYKLKNFHF